MTYSEAMKYISGTSWFGAEPCLDRITELLEALGRPQDGGLADGQRLGVALARLRGEAAVGGIAYLRCRICSFYADGQLTAVVESVRLAEAGLGHSCRRDEACENEFADLVHFADILGFRLQR